MPTALLIVAGALLCSQVSSWWYPTTDGVSYLSMARNLSEGRLERLGGRNLYFAPGYPILIAPAFIAGPRPFLLISIIHVALAIAVLVAVFNWARSMLAAMPAAILAALTTLNPTFWNYVRVTLSEITFMACWMGALLAMRALLDSNPGRARLISCAGASVLLLFTCVTRQVGTVLAIAFLLRLAIDVSASRLTWRSATKAATLVCLPAAVAAAALVMRQSVDGELSGSFYLSQFLVADSSLAPRLAEGLRLRIMHTGQLVIPGMHTSDFTGWLNINLLVYGALAVALTVGWWRLVRRYRDLFALAAPLYVAVYLLWPYDESSRFMLPLTPLLLMALWQVLERWPVPRLRTMGVMLVAQALIGIWSWLQIAPEARRLHALWPQLDQFTEKLGAQRQRAATVKGTPRKPLHMFSLALDRRIPSYSGLDDVPQDFVWVVAATDVEATDGFDVHGQIGELRILRRRPP